MNPELLKILEEKRSLIAELDNASPERLIEIEARTGELNALEAQILKEGTDAEKRSRLAELLGTGNIEARQIDISNSKAIESDNVLATEEYRNAFLKNLQGKTLNQSEERVLTTAAASAGAAVPETTMNMVIDKLRQTSVLFPLITVMNIPGDVKLTVANAKNAAAWKAEGTDGTPADDTVAEVSLKGYELIKLVEISKAARAMTIPAFEQYIVAELGRQMAIAIENAILNGTGSANDQPDGIIASITWITGTNQIEYTLDGEPTYDNFVDMLALLPTMYHRNAKFVCDRQFFFRIKKIKDNDGRPLFTYNPQDEFSGSILGYPVIIDDYAPAETCLLGDYTYYYFNFSAPVEIDSDDSVGFKSGKRTYRGLAVADGKPALEEMFIYLVEASA